MSRVLGIVPARGGSKRVPRKNLRLLGGKPLVVWAIEAAMKAQRLTRVVLSSDDEQILALSRGAGANVLALRRPDELSTDSALAIEYVHHVAAELNAMGEEVFDAVAIVQPSSPFTLGEDIDATVDLLLRSDADSAVSVMQVEHAVHPLKLKRLEGTRLVPYLEEERGRMTEHDMPPVYVRNGSVYASRRATLERGSIIGESSRGHVMPRERSLDINDELDLAFAEFLLERRP